MHIPDGYLSPATYLTGYATALPFWAYAFRRLRRILEARTLPLLASLTALAFVVQMINVPIPGGTSGHALGTAVLAILFGPWVAFLSMSLVLLLQALLFADGGVTAFAVNALSMGLVAAFAAHWTYGLLGRRWPGPAAFLAGWVASVASSVAIALVLGIQPWVARGPDGRPLFFPFDLGVTLPALAGSHALFFGPLEGAFTAAVVRFLSSVQEVAREPVP